MMVTADCKQGESKSKKLIRHSLVYAFLLIIIGLLGCSAEALDGTVNLESEFRQLKAQRHGLYYKAIYDCPELALQHPIESALTTDIDNMRNRAMSEIEFQKPLGHTKARTSCSRLYSPYYVLHNASSPTPIDGITVDLSPHSAKNNDSRIDVRQVVWQFELEGQAAKAFTLFIQEYAPDAVAIEQSELYSFNQAAIQCEYQEYSITIYDPPVEVKQHQCFLVIRNAAYISILMFYDPPYNRAQHLEYLLETISSRLK